MCSTYVLRKPSPMLRAKKGMITTMQFLMKIGVTAGKARLLQMPRIVQGTDDVAMLEVTFDTSWDAFSTRYAVFWREGEAVLRLPLGADHTVKIPPLFSNSDKPFFAHVVGENGHRRILTNELCAKFEHLCSLNPTDPAYNVYDGVYTLTENKKYPTKNLLLADDLTVQVDSVDTSRDTVTPETLLDGITAHDASGNAITGTYVPPAGLPNSVVVLTPVSARIRVTQTARTVFKIER